MSAHTFEGQVAIVTGAGKGTGGVGRAIAMRLAAEGARVMVADVDPRVAENAAEIAAATGAETAAAAGSLADEANVQAMVAATIARWGRVDILVNNAGGGIIRPFLEHDAASLTETLARNLWTAIWCCHKVLPHMVRQNYGRIVNVGADSLRTGIPNHAGYNAAKGGVIGMSVALARDFAAHDITVNTVSPCLIKTERFKGLQQTDPALAARFEAVIPKGRGVEIPEVVDAVCFLARRESGFITGQELSVNGGSAMP
ncbi:MAG: SDR family oxidoreductase [Burkholderiales bacterium]|nr:SDR family oxidoreductase [Burkholderiales bacterium]